MRQPHTTAGLLHLAGDALRPLMERDPPALPQRFDHAGLLLARPSRAILGGLLDSHLHPVIGPLLCPPLGRCSCGIGTAARLLVRHLAYGRCPWRSGRLELTLEVLLPPLILATGGDPHGPIGFALEGALPLGHFRAGPWPVLGRGRRGQHASLCPPVVGHGLGHDAPTRTVGRGKAGDQQGSPEGCTMGFGHEGDVRHVDIGPRGHPMAREAWRHRG